MRSVDKIASCEIAFIPIISDNYISDVKKVLSIIKSYDLEHSVGLLSTTIRGERDKILSLIKEIYEKMDEECGFTIDIKISNVCGCSSHAETPPEKL